MTTRCTSLAGACTGPSASYAVFAGLCASLVAIGLARFAYTPLIPELIKAGWFAPGDVVWLGAANFAGYFAGALLGRRMGARWGHRAMLRAMMAAAALSFAACAAPLSLSWFFAWRFVSGFAGAVVMVLVAQTVLPMVAPARRGMAGGAIFMGVGAGIALSGVLVPPLLRAGLPAAWLGLAACSALLSALSWRAWPARDAAAQRAEPVAALPLRVRLLYAEYAAVAVGLVPAAVFLVDYVARGLHQGTAQGALYWVVYGAGAVSGPMLYGLLADRIGFGRALRLGLLLAAAAALLMAAWPQAPSLLAASLLLGAFTPGVVTLMIGRLHELLPGRHAAQHAAWSRSTSMFALFQALAGYGLSWVFARNGGQHRVLFMAAGGAFALALLLDLLGGMLRREG
ncbi:YbfB/YjiJ family MFS transporter [Massilia sp. ST3]|uniref:YbfB/YjiJ family MFS transporter n=1 Tax=Massilia sp. ST3 TaxID=2824903 RepID=UPI001E3AFE1F|nr:YbfB/YjiJ family MFS transporter [Massilia sp. ST3]